jgi:hypothetical protein
MKYLTLTDLKQMVGSHEPCLSSYISLVGSNDLDREKLENNLSSAILQARAMFPEVSDSFGDVDIPALLARISVFDSNSENDLQPWKSVAYFKSPSLEGYYPLADMQEDLVVLANSYHLKPLFGLIQVKPRYALLHVEDTGLTLYTGAALGISQPKRFERKLDTVNWQAQDALSPVRRRLASIERSRLEKKNIIKFFRETESKIRRIVNLDEIPAILMGTSKAIKSFIVANRFRTSFIRTIDTDKITVVKDLDYMHHLSLESLAANDRSRALKGVFEFKHLRRFGCAIDTLGHVAKAANDGIVRSLLIRRGVNLWGKVIPQSATVHLGHSADFCANDDILDDIGEMVLAKGGEVYLLNAREMPTQSPVAAVLAASLSA